MCDTKFIIASTIIHKYCPTLRECIMKLAEMNVKGEITRHTEVGSITFKLE